MTGVDHKSKAPCGRPVEKGLCHEALGTPLACHLRGLTSARLLADAKASGKPSSPAPRGPCLRFRKAGCGVPTKHR